MKNIKKLVKRMWRDLLHKNKGEYFFFLGVAIVSYFVFNLMQLEQEFTEYVEVIFFFMITIVCSIVFVVVLIIIVAAICDAVSMTVEYFKRIIEEELE